MIPEVEQAIKEIKEAFPGHKVDITPEGQGGAYVIVHDLLFGDVYTPFTGWVGFLINFQYPRSDVYPHFIDCSINRKDKCSFGAGFSLTQWQNRDVRQISRRSNRLNPAIDTAASKLAKVLDWIRAK